MKIGIVGFGALGKFLFDKVKEEGEKVDIKVEWIWNRTASRITEYGVASSLVLSSFDDIQNRPVDLIVEVAHSSIVAEEGPRFLQFASLFVGSPTAFAIGDTEKRLLEAAEKNKHCVFIPSGALWGAEDILKMGERGSIAALSLEMRKHPSHLKVEPPLDALLPKDGEGEKVIYSGSVLDLCPLAPQNVNSLAAAAIASKLGLANVTARLVADPSLESHQIIVEVKGKDRGDGRQLTVRTVRDNPAKPGSVTGQETYVSFFSSLVRARPSGDGGLRFV